MNIYVLEGHIVRLILKLTYNVLRINIKPHEVKKFVSIALLVTSVQAQD